jgi:hypothetical protein
MIFSTRSTYLTCAQVAEREGLTRQSVARLCRLDAIFPVMKHGNAWLIDRGYAISGTAGTPGRPTLAVRAKHARRGRPKGVKNSRPYPKGVKRPRQARPSIKRNSTTT